MDMKTRVLVTGSRGFIGKNLLIRLRELQDYEVIEFRRGDAFDSLPRLVSSVDVIFHLAGENRPANIEAFYVVNRDLTEALCRAIKASGRSLPVVFASSVHADQDNAYGRSKREAEQALEQLSVETGNPVVIYRLPGVFGKWSRPNYNSVVATFCHNIANDLAIRINDPDAYIRLVYVDDVITDFISGINTMVPGVSRAEVRPEYTVTLGALAARIRAFRNSRSTLVSERVGLGLERALYATYLSYLAPDQFTYELSSYRDGRGAFVEFLKTNDSGQFSYFTANPGVTRGGHYHHTKSEKFLVVHGAARFRFRHVLTNVTHELFTTHDKPQVVETVPGWTHDITNVGNEELVVLLWASEIFNRQQPDTVALKVWE